VGESVMKIGKSIIKGGFKRKVFLIFIMVAIIISQPLNLVQAWELPDGQEPFNIVEIKPEIKPGQGLVKINFRLPQGSFITDDFVNFFVLCDYVNSKGEEKMNTKNLYMLKYSRSYTAYMPIDTTGGSASCKFYYIVQGNRGYLNGYLSEEGTKMMNGRFPLETDILKEIEVKEGSVVEIDLEAVKGVTFSTKILWEDMDTVTTNPNQITSKPNRIGIEFIEKSTDIDINEENHSEYEKNNEHVNAKDNNTVDNNVGNIGDNEDGNIEDNNKENNSLEENKTESNSTLENSTTIYYSFTGNENEISVTYTLAQDKKYALSLYIEETNTYYNFGYINIDDEARKTGYLQYQPILINKLPANNISIDNLPLNDINVSYVSQEWKHLLMEKIRDIINRIIKPEMSDIDKVYAIFKYVQNNTVYGFSSNCSNAYGALMENISVCEGYAQATKKLLDAAGIENKMAYGIKGDGMESGPHAWNIVKIGDEYFHLDTLQNRFNLNDSDARKEYYTWEEGSIPECSSSFSIGQGLSFFVHDGYVYYTTGDNRSFYFEINRCRPDGSENTKLITTQYPGTYIHYYDGWIYYFNYEGSNIYRVRPDGSEESLVHTFEHSTRIHDSGISGNTIYFLVQTGYNGEYQKSIKKFDLDSFEAATIATFGENMNYWNVGDYFYYYKAEGPYLNYYKMTLDGSEEILIYSRERY